MNSAAHFTDAPRSPEKRFADLAAALAFKSFELKRLEGGPLLILKWNMSREVATLDDAEAFARQVGAIA